jgi:hypothetical protein
MDMRKDRWDPMGDVCAACSNPETGVWVPVSFCPEAKKDADRYYDEIDLGQLAMLTKILERTREK